ncbi:MAG: outer membrane beta-barrel protein [Bacteroidetes bacterium]|nr:outer membrane beta-barrel protein [Bacteroidota bacterium]
MSKFRIHRSFEEELAKKANEFSMQPSAGSWSRIDQGVQETIFTKRLWKFTGLGSGLALVIAFFVYSTYFNSEESLRAEDDQEITSLFTNPVPASVATPVNPVPAELDKSQNREERLNISSDKNISQYTRSLPSFNRPEKVVEEHLDQAKTIGIAPKNLRINLDKKEENLILKKRVKTPLLPKDGWNIQASFTPVYAYRSLNAKIDEAKPLENKKNELDKGITSFNASVMARYHFTNKFSVAFGVTYSQFGEVIGIGPKRQNPVYDAMALEYGYNPNNMRTPGNANSYTNRYHYLQVPVMVYMKNPLGNSRFSLSSGLGISLGYLLSQKSMVYDYRVEHYVENKNFLRNYNAMAHAQALLEYSVNTRWTVQAGPQLNYSLVSTYQNYYTISQHQYSVGMSFGLQWKVFRFDKRRGVKL